MTLNRCRYVVNRIAECGDVELDAAERQRVQTHIRWCESCRHEFNWQMALRQSLRSLPDLAIPRGLADRLFAGLETTRRHRRNWAMSASAVAASFLIALGFALYPLPDSGDIASLNVKIRVWADSLTTIRLGIDARHDLGDVELALVLPRRIAWHTRLAAGRSLLKLNIKAQPNASGVLSTVLRRHENEDVFRFRIATSAVARGAAPQGSAVPMQQT